MNKTDPDLQWVTKAQEGDKTAFDQLVLKHQSRLLSVINQHIKDPTEALDVLQDTFLKAFKSIKNFRKDSAFYTWLYRIAVNTAKNHLAYLERHPTQGDYDFEKIELQEPDKIAMKINNKNASIRDILKAFETLPKHLQAILTLREIAGLSYAEIAEAMDIPIGTVRSRIARARAMLVK